MGYKWKFKANATFKRGAVAQIYRLILCGIVVDVAAVAKGATCVRWTITPLWYEWDLVKEVGKKDFTKVLIKKYKIVDKW